MERPHACGDVGSSHMFVAYVSGSEALRRSWCGRERNGGAHWVGVRECRLGTHEYILVGIWLFTKAGFLGSSLLIDFQRHP